MCNPGGKLDLLEAIAALLEKNLLRREGVDGSRYSMLDTIREYGANTLDGNGEKSRIEEAHTRYFLQLAEEADPKLAGPAQLEWLDRLEAEHDNLRAALRGMLDRGRPELALHLAGALARFWRIRGFAREGKHWLEESLRAAEGASKAERARALAACAPLLWHLGELDLTEAYTREALGLFRELGDRARISFCLNLFGNIAFVQANYERAGKLYQESLEVSQELELNVEAALTLGNMGLVAHMMGECERAAAFLDESAQQLQRLNHAAYSAYVLVCLSRDLRELGDLERSEMVVQEGLSLGRHVGWHHAICAGLVSLGDLAFARAEYERAQALYEEAIHEQRMWGEVVSSHFVLSSLGQVTMELGDVCRARDLLREALVLARRHHVYAFLPFALEIVAWLLTRGGKLERAVQLFGGAEALRHATRELASPSERARNQERMAVSREQLDQATWKVHWSKGQARSRTQLVEDALEGIDSLGSSLF